MNSPSISHHPYNQHTRTHVRTHARTHARTLSHTYIRTSTGFSSKNPPRSAGEGLSGESVSVSEVRPNTSAVHELQSVLRGKRAFGFGVKVFGRGGVCKVVVLCFCFTFSVCFFFIPLSLLSPSFSLSLPLSPSLSLSLHPCVRACVYENVHFYPTQI